MVEPGAPQPKKKTLSWVLAGVAGCLGLLVLVALAGVIVWWLARPDDGDDKTTVSTEEPAAVVGDTAIEPAVGDNVDWIVLGNGDSIPITRGAPEPEPEGGIVTVTGRIVDAQTGAPVADAQIMILGGPSTAPLITYTDEQGVYEFRRPRGWTYSLTITAGGHNPGIYPNSLELTADDPATVELEDLALDPQ